MRVVTVGLGAMLASLILASTVACSPGVSVDDIDWGNLPEGTKEWVLEGFENNNCKPLRNTFAYVSVYEQDKQAPSKLFEYLSSEYEARGCERPSEYEQIEDLLNSQQELEDIPVTAERELNPFWHGPGCIGIAQTFEDFKKPPSGASPEGLLRSIGLMASAILASLPPEVTKTGTREPHRTEFLAMATASEILDFGDALLSTQPDADKQLSMSQSRIEILYVQFVGACAEEYENGPQPKGNLLF